jgi:hypothetical protein
MGMDTEVSGSTLPGGCQSACLPTYLPTRKHSRDSLAKGDLLQREPYGGGVGRSAILLKILS